MQTQKRPHVSVVMPAYNRERYIGEAIESVLGQEGCTVGLIVVDDGSRDATAQRVARYPEVRYLYQENAGQAAAKNTGIREADGEFLAFIDSDDIWTEGRLSRQVRYLREHPDVRMVFGGVEQFCSEEHRHLHRRSLEKTIRGITAGTMLIRREDFLKIGLFRTDLRVGEFIEWFDRASAAGYRYHLFGEVFLKRRLHDTNIGLQRHGGPNDFAKILRASLERKRRKGGD